MVSDGLEFYPLYPNAFFSLYNFIVLCRVAKWLLESHVPKLGEDTNYDLNTATACHPNHPIIPFMALCIPFLALSDSCHAHIAVSASSCCHAMQWKRELTRKSGRQCLIWHIAQQLMVAQENCRWTFCIVVIVIRAAILCFMMILKGFTWRETNVMWRTYTYMWYTSYDMSHIIWLILWLIKLYP